jgi:3,4-dihydroxy 2-butanone 4-phosphate synthase/GTP cyclohydrolase II
MASWFDRARAGDPLGWRLSGMIADPEPLGKRRSETYNRIDLQVGIARRGAAAEETKRGAGVSSRFSTIEDAMEAIRAGRIVVVVDAEDRENEGDFVCAAERVTPDVVNFMITHGRGQLCMPLLPEISQRLDLPLMVGQNTAPLGTNYTVTVDHRSIKTGITAAERARTIRALCDPASKPTDFTRPGHVQPLVAKEGGVLRRAGHTEATVDLARLAGLTPAGVLCEILNESGDRADREQLHALAHRFDLRIISIEQLIAYRRVREKLVHREAEARLPTRYGTGTIISYRVDYESQQPLVFVLGDPTKVAEPLVRLHSSCFTGDLLESLRCDCGDQLHMALDMIKSEGTGVLVYLPQEGRGIGIAEKIKAYALQDQGLDTVEANLALGFKADPRDYGVGIQLLKDLGLRKVRLLTNNPKKTDAFIYGGFDLEVVDQIPIMPPINEYNARYLATKRDKLGHHLPQVDS